ncbi:IclR family transcriptional regulator [Ureibacillus massiliensis 4400831 = CIP 108448 = CCUG 49529]|uniref:IclR family transcriptional regulator n=1 Tax=Ureibacillus massiliensis 4400831 = CIP 108448 = CCUG 49529 TaxID=1211035 RepID=A0A0A3JRJ6_9BACL|nr:IclR family transcriptional regulator [Ureibacillus massiliensis]KGR89647.1 IclR family transcriptional regulator [Ureibacillus massiliensis 4400831 = CIP 108448 = CCUG 49529]
MNEKYWNPALERADKVLNLIAENPSKYRLIDISKKLEINKSTLFILINTMEKLGWITKHIGDVYSLGGTMGSLGAAYLKQFNLLHAFYEEAAEVQMKVKENLQLGILDGGDVIYLGKVKDDSMVQLVTEPGMKFPAYATSIGKIQLSQYSLEELKNIYSEEPLMSKTPYTITSVEKLYENLQQAKVQGYIEEHQESAEGIHCVAAPVYDFNKRIIAGVSIAMITAHWEKKGDMARKEVVKLANQLSLRSGYSKEQ